jgi:hypothetical protein
VRTFLRSSIVAGPRDLWPGTCLSQTVGKRGLSGTSSPRTTETYKEPIEYRRNREKTDLCCRAERKKVVQRAERPVRARRARSRADIADRGANSGSAANSSGKGVKVREKRESGEPQDECARRAVMEIIAKSCGKFVNSPQRNRGVLRQGKELTRFTLSKVGKRGCERVLAPNCILLT